MAPPPNLINACRPVIERLQRQPAPRRLAMAKDLTAQLQEVQAQIAACRRAAVRELRADSWTLAAIAREAGITVSRVKQIEEGSPSHSTTDD